MIVPCDNGRILKRKCGERVQNRSEPKTVGLATVRGPGTAGVFRGWNLNLIRPVGFKAGVFVVLGYVPAEITILIWASRR